MSELLSNYLILLLLVISIPLGGSFERRVAYYKTWPALFPAMLLTLVPFIIWDILFTHHGIWWFNSDYYGPITLAGLPLEEWLFFLAIPYSCLYIYAWIKYARRHKPERFTPAMGYAFWIVGLASMLFSLYHFDRSYTLVVFGTLGFTCMVIALTRPAFTANFLIAFLITKIPFFLVNGYLTGKPVVLYDELENLAVRMHTIPVEDAFYSFLLLFINTWFYEYFLRKRRMKAS